MVSTIGHHHVVRPDVEPLLGLDEREPVVLGRGVLGLLITDPQSNIGVRLANSGEQGVAVLMRYTLRLLTLQQFQRATALLSPEAPGDILQRNRPTVRVGPPEGLAAARLLRASGAPADMAAALYAYNPSRRYVRAVSAYASQLHADRRAFLGYYHWQVFYGDTLLPEGYPARPPIPAPG